MCIWPPLIVLSRKSRAGMNYHRVYILHLIVHSLKSRSGMNCQSVYLTTFDSWFLQSQSGNELSKVVIYTFGYFFPTNHKQESSYRLPNVFFSIYQLYLHQGNTRINKSKSKQTAYCSTNNMCKLHTSYILNRGNFTLSVIKKN